MMPYDIVCTSSRFHKGDYQSELTRFIARLHIEIATDTDVSITRELEHGT